LRWWTPCFALLAGCLGDPTDPATVATDSDSPGTPAESEATDSLSESEATPDTEAPPETDPSTDSLPVGDSETSPESDSPVESATSDSEPLPDSESSTDTETALDSPRESGLAGDSEASVDSEAPFESDSPEDSERTPDTDTFTAVGGSESDGVAETDDPPLHTDLPGESMADSLVDDTLAPHTDTSATPVDSDDEDPPHAWPIPPQCTFRTDGVYAPTSEWRSLDFDNHAGDYLVASNRFVTLDDSGSNKLVLTLGDSPSRLWIGLVDAPGPGISHYTNELVASIQSPGNQYFVSMTAAGLVDLDADDNQDVLYFTQDVINHCMGMTAPAGARSTETWDWRFDDTSVPGALDWCGPDDINGDGHTDIHAVFTLSNWASETKWYLGPFPRGDVDLTGTAALRLALPNSSRGFHALGDYNGDGQVDLAFAWYGADLVDGEILIWFGPLGGDLDPHLPDLRIESTSGSGYFANHLVINAGDIDGDGTDDLAFKSTEHRNGYPSSNAVYVFKGPLQPGPGFLDDDADSIITWPATMARTGNFLIPLGDVDGDERDDFAVNVWAGRHRPPDGFPLRPIWPPELVPPEGSDSAAPIDTEVGDTDTGDSPILPIDSWDTSTPSGPPPHYNPFPWGLAQGAIMVFGDTPPGEIGPQQAKFTLAGTRPGDWIGRVGMIGPGDLNGDGLADIAYSADPYGTGVRVRVVFPCTDFAEPVTP
jgi:hypothetical protein